MGKRKIEFRCVTRLVWQASMVAVLLWTLAYPFPFPVSQGSFRSQAAPSDAATVSTATREGRLAVFDDAWSTINERYYDRAFSGLANGSSWEGQKNAFRNLAAEAGSSQELYAVLRRMIAALNDPHTRVFSPEEKFDWWRPRFVTLGLAVRDVGGLPTVVKVESGSSPQRAGIRAGDVIETVDGVPALHLIGQRLKEAESPTSASRRFRVFAGLLDGPADTFVELRWKEKNGKDKSGRFQRYWQQRELSLRIYKEDGNLAVVEIDAFTRPIAAEFARETAKLNASRGIVLDLRANGGGDAEAMADIASAFLGAGYDLGEFTDRSGGGFTLSTRIYSPFMPERISPIRAPLVVLTSERTSSASEIFIAALKASGRASIVGTETCGCVLAIRTRHLLPDGGLLDVSELDYQTANGERLEKHGIKPDQMMVLDRNDLYSGRDRLMQSALIQLTRIRAQLN